MEIRSVDLTVPTCRPCAVRGYFKCPVNVIKQQSDHCLCFAGLWYYGWHIFESAPHAIPSAIFVGKSLKKHFSVFPVSDVKYYSLHWWGNTGIAVQFTGYFSLSMQWVFLPDQEQRSQLVLPPPVHVDYRAACFCHRNLIEIGYVCSVCLSSKFINI